MEQAEVELIKRAQNGDSHAFDALVRLHDRRVLQMAYSMLNNLHDAQDVYQETFLRAFVKIATFRFDASFATWLSRIAINLSINKRKQKRRMNWLSFDQGNRDAELHGEFIDRHNYEHSAEEDAAANEMAERLQRSLDVLSPPQRAVFTLKHLHGYKIREISEMLNCAEGTVKNYLFRATRKLQKELAPYFKSPA